MSTQLEQQAQEAITLLADLAALGMEVDEETVEITVSSETSLAEAVASALVEAAGAEAAAAATADLITKLVQRRERQLARAERIRARVARALDSLGLRRLVTPAGTVSVVAAPARVIVTDEAAIPLAWWRERTTRHLDKAGIRKALMEGREVYGVTLSNRPATIRVRT
jgi:Siphovirus Gp157